MSLKNLYRQSAEAAGTPRVRPKEGLGPITLPMSAYYRRSDEFEARREAFYAACRRVFGWKEPKPITGEIGRDGQRLLKEKYGHDAIHSFRNNTVAPVEFFESMKPRKNPLNDPLRKNASEDSAYKAIEAGIRRARLARLYRDAKERYMVSPLRSVDLEYVGAPGFGPRNASDASVDAMKEVSKYEARMPVDVMEDMELCLVGEKFIFDVPSRRAREMALDRLRLGLDIIAVERSEMKLPDFRARWPQCNAFDPGYVLRRMAKGKGRR